MLRGQMLGAVIVGDTVISTGRGTARMNCPSRASLMFRRLKNQLMAEPVGQMAVGDFDEAARIIRACTVRKEVPAEKRKTTVV